MTIQSQLGLMCDQRVGGCGGLSDYVNNPLKNGEAVTNPGVE